MKHPESDFGSNDNRPSKARRAARAIRSTLRDIISGPWDAICGYPLLMARAAERSGLPEPAWPLLAPDARDVAWLNDGNRTPADLLEMHEDGLMSLDDRSELSWLNDKNRSTEEIIGHIGLDRDHFRDLQFLQSDSFDSDTFVHRAGIPLPDYRQVHTLHREDFTAHDLFEAFDKTPPRVE